MRFITLTKVDTRAARAEYNEGDAFRDTDDVNEPQQGRPATETPALNPDARKVVINVEAIRCFNPRKDNAPGSRITFMDGGGFPVEEDFATLLSLVNPN